MHIIYASAASEPFEEQELIALLNKARSNNQSIGVSGILLIHEQSFFQIIEGHPATVQALYDKIAADPRHQKVSVIISEPIAERSFAEWTMGHSDVSAADLQAIDGTNDFFADGNCFTDLNKGRAKKLMRAFSQGSWRLGLEANAG